jgi:Protein of unknown function (DUF3256).
MKKIIILSLTVLFAVTLSAQDAKTVFAAIPDSLVPTLTAINRADFVDFIESKMTAKVKNKLEGESEMTNLTDSYIRIKTTDKSIWEMKLLSTSNDKKIICVVTTACAPVCDSTIKFYSADWKELPLAEYITLPVADNFYKTPSESQQNDYNLLRKKADLFLMKAELDKDADKISFTYTTPDYMERGDKEKIQPYVQSTLVLTWSGNKFASSI